MRIGLPALTPLLLAAGLAACGGSDNGEERSQGVTFEAAIREARSVDARDFPRPRGRTLQQIAKTLPEVDVGLATSVFTPGRNRLAFGVIDERRSFVYGKSAVYVARGPDARARGPYPAPADPLVVDPAFRSRGAAQESDALAAIYEAQVELPRAGDWTVLTVTRAGGRLYGAGATITVAKSSRVPAVGARAPRVETETRASAGGDLEKIETRVPPDDMHERSFREVVGRKPVALLFATPALCESRVCGPVVDIAAQLKRKYGDRVEFIHQEVYVDNDLERGLRPPLRAFELRTEPWLFTIDRDGRVAARLEGSFGNEAFERALKAAL
jgi:hypothetical protein